MGKEISAATDVVGDSDAHFNKKARRRARVVAEVGKLPVGLAGPPRKKELEVQIGESEAGTVLCRDACPYCAYPTRP